MIELESRLLPNRVFLLVLLLVMFSIGVAVFDDYGQSWDEYFNYEAGKRAFEAYRSGEFLRGQADGYYHGTFYFMFFNIIPEFLSRLRPDWLASDLRHLLNYMMFLIAITSLHSLVRTQVGERIANLSAVLLAAQPLFFGHAFINQKDIPFLAAFLASMTTGLRITHTLSGGGSTQSSGGGSIPNRDQFLAQLRTTWGRSSISRRVLLVACSLTAVILMLDLIFPLFLLPAGTRLLEIAYHGQAPALIQRAFEAVATDAAKTPLQLYIQKLAGMTFWVEVVILVSIAFFLRYVMRASGGSGPDSENAHVTKWGAVLSAAVLMGISISIRIFGAFSGVLVTLFLILEQRKLDIKALVVYWGAALLTMYLAWPALWGKPVEGIATRIVETASFESHNIFFEGAVFNSTDLPLSYLPSLLIRQLSGPLLAGIVLGIVILIVRRNSWRSQRAFLMICVLWFSLPVLAQMAYGFSIYGNFRQLLFITPPLFLLGAVGWEFIIQRLPDRPVNYLVLIVVIIPLVSHIIAYHPYEYVYYNAISGGVSRAQGSYALDYWCTSYREAIEWVNSSAPEGSEVRVYGPDINPTTYGREDLIIVPDWIPAELPDYYLLCTSLTPRPGIEPNLEHLHSVERRGTVLAEIYGR